MKNLRKSLCFSYRRARGREFLKTRGREETHSNGERGGGWANCPKSSEIRGKDGKVRDSFREKTFSTFEITSGRKIYLAEFWIILSTIYGASIKQISFPNSRDFNRETTKLEKKRTYFTCIFYGRMASHGWDKFHFRYFKMKGIYATFPIWITLFSNLLKWNAS